MMKNTLEKIRNLPFEARKLFAEILVEGNLVDRKYYENRIGWEYLVHHNLLNCWEDDEGNEYCEIGEQS